MAKVLLASSLARGKEYSAPLLLSTVRELQGVSDVIVTLDGINWDIPIGWHCQRLVDDPALIIHGRLARMRKGQRQLFLSGDWTHLYWHDSDMVPPVDIIPRLLALDVPVASGIYNRRGDKEVCLCVFSRFGVREGERPGDTVVDEIEMVDGVASMAGAGMGCMLVQRDILERFGFREPSSYTMDGNGEDVRWCRDLYEAGIPVTVDWKLPCWHVDDDGTGTRPIVPI